MSQAALIVQMANVIADQEGEIFTLRGDREWWKSEYNRVMSELEKSTEENHKLRANPFSIPDYVRTDLSQMLEAHYPNKKIEQIKFIRGLTNLGLKEAKDWVEANIPYIPF